MTDIPYEFGEKLEIIGRGIPPFRKLFRREHPIKCRVQFDTVELAGVKFKLVFCTSRVEILQVLPVPFGTAHMNGKGLVLVLFGEKHFRIRMIFWDSEVYEFWFCLLYTSPSPRD